MANYININNNKKTVTFNCDYIENTYFVRFAYSATSPTENRVILWDSDFNTDATGVILPWGKDSFPFTQTIDFGFKNVVGDIGYYIIYRGINKGVNTEVVTTLYYDGADVIIDIYNSKSERTRLDKSPYLTIKTQMSGYFRGEQSILNPEVELVINNLGDTDPDYLQYNYFYIKQFNRYYFVDNITVVRSEVGSGNLPRMLVRYSLSVDVLMSFKDSIKELEPVILRQEFDFDNLIPDDELPSLISNDIIYIRSSTDNEFFLSKEFNPSTDACYVVNFLAAWAPTEWLKIKNKIPFSTNAYSYNTYICTYTQLINLMYYVNKADWSDNINLLFYNIADYVVNIKMYPFNINGKNGKQVNFIEELAPYITTDILHIANSDIKMNKVATWGEDPNFNVLVFPAKCVDICEYKFDLSEIYEDKYLFLMFDPYSKVSLYIPFYGYIPIHIRDYYYYFNGHKIKIYVKLNLDIITGMCTITLHRYITYTNNGVTQEYVDTDRVVDIITFQLGVDIPFGGTGASDLMRNITLNSIKGGMALVKGVTSLVAGSPEAPTPEYTPKTGRLTAKYRRQEQTYNESVRKDTGRRITETAQTISDMTASLCSSYVRPNSAKGESNRTNSLYLYNKAYIQINKYIIKEPDNYASLVGRPCSKKLKISTLNGYTQVGACHIENIPNATSTECDEIEAILKSGFICPDKTT